MLHPPNYLSVPQEGYEALRILLVCRHYPHAVCVLNSLRSEHLPFLRLYIQTLQFPSAPEGVHDESWS